MVSDALASHGAQGTAASHLWLGLATSLSPHPPSLGRDLGWSMTCGTLVCCATWCADPISNGCIGVLETGPYSFVVFVVVVVVVVVMLMHIWYDCSCAVVFVVVLFLYCCLIVFLKKWISRRKTRRKLRKWEEQNEETTPPPKKKNINKYKGTKISKIRTALRRIYNIKEIDTTSKIKNDKNQKCYVRTEHLLNRGMSNPLNGK